MKLNFSLSLKLTVMVVLVSAIVIFSLTYINIEEQAISLENVYSDKAVTLSQALDTAIGDHDELTDKQKLQNYILNFSNLNPRCHNIFASITNANLPVYQF